MKNLNKFFLHYLTGFIGHDFWSRLQLIQLLIKCDLFSWRDAWEIMTYDPIRQTPSLIEKLDEETTDALFQAYYKDADFVIYKSQTGNFIGFLKGGSNLFAFSMIRHNIVISKVFDPILQNAIVIFLFKE